MKKSRAETEQTRRRIVATASRRLRRDGIDATGVAEVMADAGLTHGGFYRHFDSKEQLVAEAYAAGLESLTAPTAMTTRKPRGRQALPAIAANYLSTAHR